MARYRRRRFYRRRGRWSANIYNIGSAVNIPAGDGNADSITLAQNPAQSQLGVSQTYTVKNIELSVYIESDSSTNLQYLENIQHYIMYVPQGLAISPNLPTQHPEYIMNYYYQGNPQDDSEGLGFRLKLKSRLARRLQTGDSIVYLYKVDNTYNQTIPIRVRGLCRWWTKAN